jgi:hypothetical protein
VRRRVRATKKLTRVGVEVDQGERTTGSANLTGVIVGVAMHASVARDAVGVRRSAESKERETEGGRRTD